MNTFRHAISGPGIASTGDSDKSINFGPGRGSTGLLVAVPVLSLMLAAWMVLPAAPAGFDWDDTWYLWMAEWLTGRPDHQQTALLMMQLRQYPPLFPYLLSLTGEVLADHRNGLFMNAAFLAGGAGLAMAWLMREGTPRLAAVAGAALVAFNPVALEFIPSLMSEPLFILLSISALALAGLRPDSRMTWVLVGLLAGLAVATRSAGWALVIALLAQVLMQRRLRVLIAYFPGLAAGLLVLSYLKAGLPDAIGYLQGFRDNLTLIDWAYLRGQAAAIAAGWRQLWGSMAGALLAALLVLPGLAARLLRGRADAWYVLVSLVMLMAWPFPGQMGRFLWVLMPSLLLAATAPLAWFENERFRTLCLNVIIGALFALSLPDGLGKSVNRLLNPPGQGLQHLSRMADWTRSTDRETGLMTLKVRQQFLDDMHKISSYADDQGCIYSEYPALVSIQTLKASFASPWNTLQDVGDYDIRCPYYYLVPDALPGAARADVGRFSETHRELFRSLAPYDAGKDSVLGIFYRLSQP